MKVNFKITNALLTTIRVDLCRRHRFAHERVGFVLCGLAKSSEGILILAQNYHPAADQDYLPDPSVGAMMGPEAIRKAMEFALINRVAIFHVHSHGGIGIPDFSGVDVRENAKFVPDFLKVAPQNIHGAVVLSDTAAAGQFWVARGRDSQPITGFVEIGRPIGKWGIE